MYVYNKDGSMKFIKFGKTFYYIFHTARYFLIKLFYILNSQLNSARKKFLYFLDNNKVFLTSYVLEFSFLNNLGRTNRENNS